MLDLLRKCTVMAGSKNLGAEGAIAPSLCKVKGRVPPRIINSNKYLLNKTCLFHTVFS